MGKHYTDMLDIKIYYDNNDVVAFIPIVDVVVNMGLANEVEVATPLLREGEKFSGGNGNGET